MDHSMINIKKKIINIKIDIRDYKKLKKLFEICLI